jgi:hypothetical protein
MSQAPERNENALAGRCLAHGKQEPAGGGEVSSASRKREGKIRPGYQRELRSGQRPFSLSGIPDIRNPLFGNLLPICRCYGEPETRQVKQLLLPTVL